MKILGISEIDNDAGAALFIDGELFAAASEERFSRVKQHAGFPEEAVDWMLHKAGLRPRDLDLLVVAKPEPEAELRAVEGPLVGYDWWGMPGPIGRRALNWLAFKGFKQRRGRGRIRSLGRQISAWTEATGILPQRVVRAHHHRSHAASAYFSAGFEKALAVTCDGQGGGVTASAYRCSGSTMELLHEVKSPNSMGFFYAMVTRALGFRPARHEGKVTGLAAFREPDPDALALFRQIAYPIEGGFETPGVYGALPEVKRLVLGRGREGVAAAAQRVLEEVVTSYVAHHVQQTGLGDVALAGGVFANVKLNQRVLELPGVDRIFVFPHMADGGLGYGAVVDLLAGLQGRKSQALRDVYWGPSYDDSEIEATLLRANVDYTHAHDIERRVAKLLARGQTVARFAGRMEFGPRALGNRSILHQATDPSVNDWLNQRLDRTEFMPFAPVVLERDAPRLFEGYRGGEQAARFMTVTFPCSQSIRETMPAVVHVDGTARPQVVDAETNPGYYELIEEYGRRTGLHALINTSFNMHEEPIVMSPDDAIRAFVQSGIDALALGSFLCTKGDLA